MRVRQFFLCILSGTVLNLLVSSLVYGMLLRTYLESHASGLKEEPQLIWIVFGHLFIGICLSYIYSKIPSLSIKRGLFYGFWIGLFVSISVNSFILGTSHIYESPLTSLIDVIASATVWAAGGLGVSWAKMKIEK